MCTVFLCFVCLTKKRKITRTAQQPPLQPEEVKHVAPTDILGISSMGKAMEPWREGQFLRKERKNVGAHPYELLIFLIFFCSLRYHRQLFDFVRDCAGSSNSWFEVGAHPYELLIMIAICPSAFGKQYQITILLPAPPAAKLKSRILLCATPS